ncbi:hypothetical protein HMPREF0454_01964 [Hafnia alvei ATCC 51873]|uniref:Uncharacterized protein n=1 Tax=Hafnia alvei ATCC 51873 TaxID=1002364 RepID=G9Y5X0_HAFAL|nr:hypothetical protein HMPREF0454_01964 [Hafnia alvei ATCC 51873]
MGGIEGENGVNWGIVIVARGFLLFLRWQCMNSDAISALVLEWRYSMEWGKCPIQYPMGLR